MEDRQTVAGAYAKIQSHEDICTLRHNTINEKLDDLKTESRTVTKLAVSVLLALLGWMAIQLAGPVLHPTQTSTQTQTTVNTQTAQGALR